MSQDVEARVIYGVVHGEARDGNVMALVCEAGDLIKDIRMHHREASLLRVYRCGPADAPWVLVGVEICHTDGHKPRVLSTLTKEQERAGALVGMTLGVEEQLWIILEASCVS